MDTPDASAERASDLSDSTHSATDDAIVLGVFAESAEAIERGDVCATRCRYVSHVERADGDRGLHLVGYEVAFDEFS